MIKSFEKFNETFDWSTASSLVEGDKYENTVNGQTQLIIVPTIERIEVGDNVIWEEEDRLEYVKSLCRKEGLLKPGEYLVKSNRFSQNNESIYLHFANAADLKHGNLGKDWDGGFLVLYKVTPAKTVLRNLKYPEL